MTEATAENFVSQGLLPKEQKEKFISEVRSLRVRHFAARELQYVPANLRLGKIYSTSGGGHRQEHHTVEEVKTSIPYLEIMKTLADTGDFGQLTVQQLQRMRRIADGDYYEARKKPVEYQWGISLLKETVQIDGREENFQKLCNDYTFEIEAAMRKKQQVKLMDKEGKPLPYTKELAREEQLPQYPEHLALTVCTRDTKGQCLLDEWAAAGNCEKIKEVAAVLAKANRDKRLPDGNYQLEIVVNALKGSDADYSKDEAISVFTSSGKDLKAMRALFEGLASAGPNNVLSSVTSYIKYKHKDLVPLMAEVLKDAPDCDHLAERMENDMKRRP